MTKRRQAMLARRQVLQANICAQREQLADIAVNLQPAFRLADGAWRAVSFVRGHVMLAAGVLSLVVLRQRGMSGLIKGGLRAWRAWRFVNEFAKKITRR
ncbi:MAG: YqjK-like family protein [Nitrosomonadales bacterium]